MDDQRLIQRATEEDVSAIVSVLAANLDDPGLFQAPEKEVRANLDDFVVVRDPVRGVLGCAALRQYSETLAEILAVGVLPEFQGQRIGARLVKQCEQIAKDKGVERIWLATAKPAYFARFGYEPIPRWRLPGSVLLGKLYLVFHQPMRRWLPALLGRHTFMQRYIG